MLGFLAIFSVILSHCVYSNQRFPPIGQNSMRISLQLCIVNTSRIFFKENEEILYSLPLDSQHEPSGNVLTNNLIQALQKERAMVIRRTDNDMEEFEFDLSNKRFDNYLIQIIRRNEFDDHLKELIKDENWNPHARFVVTSSTIFENSFKLASEILQKFANVQVINSVVILSNVTNQTSFNVYTWFPYSDVDCGNNSTNFTLIDSCSFGIRQNPQIHWFDDKVPRKFNRCQIEVRMVDVYPFTIHLENDTIHDRNNYFESRGIDVNLLNVVAERLNLRMHYVSSDISMNYGDVDENRSVTGELYYINKHLADAAIGGYAKTTLRNSNFDDSMSYFQETIHWCVPNVPINTNLDGLLNAITAGAWILISITYLIITILLWISNRTNDNESSTYKLLGSCFLNSYGILLGAAVAVQPKSSKTRFVTTLLLFASFYLISAYQTLMMSALSDTNYANSIESEKDILNSAHNIYVTEFVKNALEKYKNRNNTETLLKIIEKWQQCDDVDKCIACVGLNRNSVYALPHSQIQHILKDYLNFDKEPLIKCHNQIVMSYPINILMRNGFPLFNLINGLIQRMVTSGFVLMWERELEQHHEYNQSTRYDIEITGNHHGDRLNLFSIGPIFMMLLIGEALAVLVFFGELAHSKWTKNTPSPKLKNFCTL